MISFGGHNKERGQDGPIVLNSFKLKALLWNGAPPVSQSLSPKILSSASSADRSASQVVRLEIGFLVAPARAPQTPG